MSELADIEKNMSDNQWRAGQYIIDKYSIDNPAELERTINAIQFDMETLEEDFEALEDQIEELEAEDDENCDSLEYAKIIQDIEQMNSERREFEADLNIVIYAKQLIKEQFIEAVSRKYDGRMHSNEYMSMFLYDNFGVNTLEDIYIIEKELGLPAEDDHDLKRVLMVLYSARQYLLTLDKFKRQMARSRKKLANQKILKKQRGL